jgi:hypothetical protein
LVCAITKTRSGWVEVLPYLKRAADSSMEGMQASNLR